VYAAGPRLDPRLRKAVIRLDDTSVPFAEIYRRSREHAAELDIPRPSYECVRMLLHDARRERARRRANRNTVLRVALYLESVNALNQLE
jgi:hypothetical protein